MPKAERVWLPVEEGVERGRDGHEVGRCWLWRGVRRVKALDFV